MYHSGDYAIYAHIHIITLTVLYLEADIGQVLAVPTVGKVGLDMRDDSFRGIHRHTAMVV